MRICLLNRYFPGGQTSHADSLAGALSARGHAVVLAMVNPRPARLPEEVFRGSRHGGAEIWECAGLAELRRRVAEFGPEVIHAHSQRTWWMARGISVELCIPLVITAHRPGLDTPLHRPALLAARAVIAPGPRTASTIRCRREGVQIIANAVDVQRYVPGEKPARPLVAYVGRVDNRRLAGFLAFLEATLDLPADIAFVGRSPLNTLPDHVRDKGWLLDPAPVLSRAAVVVGVGRSLLEGMASGAAGIVLGERLHGVVSPERIAALSRPNGAPPYFGDLPAVASREEMTRLLRRDLLGLITNPPRLHAFQAFGREIVCRHHRLDDRVDKFEALYDNATRAKPHGSPTRPPPVKMPWFEGAYHRSDFSLESLAAAIETAHEIIDVRLPVSGCWVGPLRRHLHGRGTAEEHDRYAAAFDQLAANGTPGAPITVDDIRALHDMAVGGQAFRRNIVRIGRYRDFAPPPQIDPLVEDLLGRIAASREVLPQRAARLHVELVGIHPFSDGNGRTSRLAASALLIRGGYRSTLLTAVEQHFRRAPRAYVRLMYRFRPGALDDGTLAGLMLAMLRSSWLLASFLRREGRMRAGLARAGIEPADQDRCLQAFDAGHLTLHDDGLGAPERPWPLVRLALGDQLIEELRFQLMRFRDELKTRPAIAH